MIIPSQLGCRSAEAYLNRGEESPFISDLYLGGGRLAQSKRGEKTDMLSTQLFGGLLISRRGHKSYIIITHICIYVLPADYIHIYIYICMYVFVRK